MINIIIVTYHLPNYPLYIPTEEVIISKIIKKNPKLFSLQIIQAEPQVKSSLFKQYPIIYINNKIIDNHSLLFFIKDLLYPKEDTNNGNGNINSHFSYLISFLKGEYRQIYMKDYKSLKPTKKPLGFPLDRIKAFYDYFITRREKDYIALIIKCFIEEYQMIFPSEIIEMNINDNDIDDNFLAIDLSKENKNEEEEDKRLLLFNKRLLLLLNQYAMNLNNTKENKGVLLEEMEVSKGWNNSIFSIGLFVGVSLLFYLLSLRKK